MNEWTSEQLRAGMEVLEQLQASWKATTDEWRKHSAMCRTLGYALYGPLDEEVIRFITGTKACYKSALSARERQQREAEVEEFAVKAMQVFFPSEEYRK